MFFLNQPFGKCSSTFFSAGVFSKREVAFQFGQTRWRDFFSQAFRAAAPQHVRCYRSNEAGDKAWLGALFGNQLQLLLDFVEGNDSFRFLFVPVFDIACVGNLFPLAVFRINSLSIRNWKLNLDWVGVFTG